MEHNIWQMAHPFYFVYRPRFTPFVNFFLDIYPLSFPSKSTVTVLFKVCFSCTVKPHKSGLIGALSCWD